MPATAADSMAALGAAMAQAGVSVGPALPSTPSWLLAPTYGPWWRWLRWWVLCWLRRPDYDRIAWLERRIVDG